MATGVVVYTDNDVQASNSGGKVQGAYGSLFTVPPWDSPIYTIFRDEDQGIPATSTEAFNSQTATFVRVTVAQFANSSLDHQFADVYIVFNSVDPDTELADRTIRRTLSVQAGIGESKLFSFEPGSVSTMHYMSTNTSADLVIRWEWTNG